jgi:hypothetical protein
MAGSEMRRKVNRKRALVLAHENPALGFAPEQHLGILGLKRGRSRVAHPGRVNWDVASLVVPLDSVPKWTALVLVE